MVDFADLTLTTPCDGVALVTLNRPSASNALNTALAVELRRLFESLSDEPARCVVLTGAGAKSFCAGADLKQRKGMTDADWAVQHSALEGMIAAVLDCPVPVIAAVNGAAIGGGLELALACDFIHASENAVFAFPEAALGIIPGLGGIPNLASALGKRRAAEILLTAERFSASDAARWGLVNRIWPAGEVVEGSLQLATRIAANAPLATGALKRVLSGVAKCELNATLREYARLVPTLDRREGVDAFHDRRVPLWSGR